MVYTVQSGVDDEDTLAYHAEDIFTDRSTALDWARTKLLYELSADLAERKKYMDKKHAEYAEAQRLHYELECKIIELRKLEATKQLPDI